MAKREKIIVIIAAVFLVAGGIYYFLSSAPAKKEKAVDAAKIKTDLNSFVTGVTATMTKETVDRNEPYIIARAEDEWGSDPFLWTTVAEATDVEGKEIEKVQFPSFTYTGFLSVGSKKMAIVNGLEYEQGEEIEPGGFVLLDIYPRRLIIGAKGKLQQITVSMQEEIL